IRDGALPRVHQPGRFRGVLLRDGGPVQRPGSRRHGRGPRAPSTRCADRIDSGAARAERTEAAVLKAGYVFLPSATVFSRASPFSRSAPSILSMFMNRPKALPMKLCFPSIDQVTTEPVGVPA